MKRLFLAFVLLGMGLGLASCIDLSEVNSIELESTPKERFEQDEEFNLSDIVIEVHYSNGNSEDLGISAPGVELVSGYYEDGDSYLLDTRELGTFTLRVTYEGFSAEFDYIVYNPDAWDGASIETPDLVDDGTYDVATYEIKTAAEFYWLTQRDLEQNEYLWGVDIKLLNDIDMGGHPFGAYTSIGNAVFDGGGHKITGLAGTMFYHIYGDLTVQDIEVEVDVNKTGPYWTFATYVTGNEVDGDIVETNVTFDHVDLSGNIFATDAVGGYIGYAFTNNPTVTFIESENDLNITALGDNSSAFVGHAAGTGEIVFDDATLDHAMNSSDLSLSAKQVGTSGVFYGNPHSNLALNDDNTIFTDIGNISSNNKDEDYFTTIEYESKGLPAGMQLQDYFEFEKVEGAEKALVTFEYTLIKGGFPRRNTETMNIDSYDTGDTVVTPIQMLYVTKDPDYIDNPNYIVNEEDIATDDNPDWGTDIKDIIIVEFVQLDADGNIILIERITYDNYNA